MLTTFARFGERAATTVTMPGIEGGQTAGRRFAAAASYVLCRDSDLYAASAAGARANLYLPAAILLINSSTRQLSCSFS
jgi:hypothetical protein